MAAAATSLFLAMLNQGYSATTALEKLKNNGAEREDFQSIINSYEQGSYKSHLENGSLDDYHYGLLKDQQIVATDFQRYLNKVFGTSPVASLMSSAEDPFDNLGQAILNDGSVVTKQQSRVINVPEQDRSTGFQSLVERSLADIALNRKDSVAETSVAETSVAETSVAETSLIQAQNNVPAESAQSSSESQNQQANFVEMLLESAHGLGISYERILASFSDFRGTDYSTLVDAVYHD